jgi:antitoxin PrlF
MTTRLTGKGQLTVPKKVRGYLGLKPGAPVIFERLATGEIVLRAATPGRKQRLRKITKSPDRSSVRMTTEEILVLLRVD